MPDKKINIVFDQGPELDKIIKEAVADAVRALASDPEIVGVFAKEFILDVLDNKLDSFNLVTYIINYPGATAQDLLTARTILKIMMKYNEGRLAVAQTRLAAEYPEDLAEYNRRIAETARKIQECLEAKEAGK